MILSEEIKDDYHTLAELYEHRHALLIALMRSHPKISWRANVPANGTPCKGWFIAGMHLPTGDISYHMPAEYWEKLDYSGIATTNKAPAWDGHDSIEVLRRLDSWKVNKDGDGKK